MPASAPVMPTQVPVVEQPTQAPAMPTRAPAVEAPTQALIPITSMPTTAPTAVPLPTQAPTVTPLPTPIPGLVGIVLPTQDESRWFLDQAVFQAAGYDVLFSQNDSTKEMANVKSLLNSGVEVIILAPVDSGASAAEIAKAAGAKVISYDRLIRDTSVVDYYVTFDIPSVGAQQAKYLVEHAQGKGNPLYLYAGHPSDNNAFNFIEGSWGVLQPKIADGTFVVKNSSAAVRFQNKATLTRNEMSEIINQITTNWDLDTAKNLAEANLTAARATDKGNVFILAPADFVARAIGDVFAADADVKSYVITGQDAEKASVQYIIDGKQSMTVFKDVRTLAKDAITAAQTFLAGSTPDVTKTYNNGKIDVPSNPSTIVSVTRDNVKQVLIDSGYYQASDFTGLP
jgi:putative multiple sugar transport system substrate-binding protein